MSIEYEYIYIYCIVHKRLTYLTCWGHFFSHGTPMWPWPIINTMNFRVYELGSMNFSVVAHSPRPPPGKQLNVPQPGFFIWYLLRFQRVKVKISGNNNRTNKIYRNRSSNTN